MNRAIIPGSFDPITLGHLDIIERSLKIFDQVTVCVFLNPDKKNVFSVSEREYLIKKAILTLENRDKIKVDSYSGLLIDYMKEQNLNVIIRGLRAFSDFEYEIQMAFLNNKMAPNIETFFLMTTENLSYVSSSSIKQIVKFGGKIDGLVPKNIQQDIISKILEWFIMDVLQWLDYLNEVVEKATEIPVTGKIILHKKDMLELIKKILHTLPDELKRSKWIISERDRIIGEAKKISEEATRDAKLKLEKEIEEHEIVIEAKNKAQNIIEMAKGEAKAITCGANDYVREVLKSLVDDIENNRKNFIESMESINSKNIYDISELYNDVSIRVKSDLDKIK